MLRISDLIYKNKSEPLVYWRWFVKGIPGDLGIHLRRYTYSRLLNTCGVNLNIMENVDIESPLTISIGNNVGINRLCQIKGEGGLFIGNDVLIGPLCVIWTINHRFNNRLIPIRKQGYEKKPVHIGDDVWIGANSIILPGATINNGAVIAAGAIVSGNVEEHTTYRSGFSKRVSDRYLEEDLMHKSIISNE